jgi:hypothetical protein
MRKNKNIQVNRDTALRPAREILGPDKSMKGYHASPI